MDLAHEVPYRILVAKEHFKCMTSLGYKTKQITTKNKQVQNGSLQYKINTNEKNKNATTTTNYTYSPAPTTQH